MPRPKAPRTGKHGTLVTTGAHKGKKKKGKKEKKGGERTRRQGPRQPGPENTERRRQQERTKKTKKPQQTGRTKPGGGRTKNKEKAATGRTRTPPGGRPARPGQGKDAHAHKRATRAWRPPTRKGRCCRPHEIAPVHRRSPPSKEGRYGRPDASVTGSTYAYHRSARSPRPTPEGPARDNPIAGPRTGTTRSDPRAPASAGASGRHKEPGSRPASMCPAQPPSKTGGASPRDGERHHGVGKADRSTESDRTGRGAAHQCGATRHAREGRCRPQPRHTNWCQATTATGCCRPGQRAQQATNHGTGTGGRQHPTHTPQTPARSGGVQAERAHKHTHTPTPQPGVAGRSGNRSPSTHTHTTQPSQEWRGTGGACTQTHTHPNTPARSGRA